MDNGARDCALFLFFVREVRRAVRAGADFTTVDREGAVRKNLRKSKPEKMGNQVEARSKKGTELKIDDHSGEGMHTRVFVPEIKSCKSGQNGRRACGCVLRLNEDERASGDLVVARKNSKCKGQSVPFWGNGNGFAQEDAALLLANCGEGTGVEARVGNSVHIMGAGDGIVLAIKGGA
jgi:hypothetical protein